MIKEEVLKLISELPDGIEVCIFHSSLNARESDGDEAGTSTGIYKDFKVYEMPADNIAARSKPFAVLDFEEETYLHDDYR
jgi:hypothetical protein